MKAEQEKLNKEIEEREKKALEERQLKEQEKERKREDIERRIREKEEERLKQQEIMKEETKRIGRNRRLYMDMEKRFEEEAREKEKEREAKLAELKNQFKPVSKDSINEHSKKYQDVLSAKKEELRRKRAMMCDSAEPRHNYRSKFYEQLLDSEKESKEREELARVEKKRMADKVNNYAKYVREMYWPAVPEKKEGKENSIRNLDPIKEQAPKKRLTRHGTADKLLKKERDSSRRPRPAHDPAVDSELQY